MAGSMSLAVTMAMAMAISVTAVAAFVRGANEPKCHLSGRLSSGQGQNPRGGGQNLCKLLHRFNPV
jgi:hypothetical protein